MEIVRNAGVAFSQKKNATVVSFNFGRLLKDEPSIEDDDTDESEFLIIDEDAMLENKLLSLIPYGSTIDF